MKTSENCSDFLVVPVLLEHSIIFMSVPVVFIFQSTQITEMVQPIIIEVSECVSNQTPPVVSIHNSPSHVVSSVISPDHLTGNIEAHLPEQVQENSSTKGNSFYYL